MSGRWRIGLVGCGTIAELDYLPQIAQMSNAQVVAVCDVDASRARAVAERFSIADWFTDVDAMLSGVDFDILADAASIPAHYEVNLKALRAGKHLYSQKPITTSSAEAAHLLREAAERGLKISAAPVHMLRPEMQEARRLIQSGAIGKVSLVRCSASHGGPEYFQYRTADPTWFYRPGAGPMLDMGVHGLHMVTGLLGPAVAVSCMAGISETVRIVRTGSFDGMEIRPEIPDNTVLLLDFGQGTFAFVDCTYCIKAQRAPSMEIFGSKGTIAFTRDRDKPLELFIDQRETGVRGWMAQSGRYPATPISAGVADLMAALEQGREPVLRAEHAMHVVEIMEKAEIAVREGRTVALETRF